MKTQTKTGPRFTEHKEKEGERCRVERWPGRYRRKDESVSREGDKRTGELRAGGVQRGSKWPSPARRRTPAALDQSPLSEAARSPPAARSTTRVPMKQQQYEAREKHGREEETNRRIFEVSRRYDEKASSA
ncbi:hypothetical protein E2C01_083810 [Portunus trituberculatus]|uniref:Uncharacterized protein n=1 Tax=Portunus trituberculatus TaxID=210409 RepID=A0A5B7J5T9_PORTR|nr:hypothetical protein [Portunus trituberculatus]